MKEDKLVLMRVLSGKHQVPFCFQFLKGLKRDPPFNLSTSQDNAYQFYPCMYQFQAVITDFMKAEESF